MKLRRILFITGALKPIGGVQLQLTYLASLLTERGVTVSLLLKDPLTLPNQHIDALRGAGVCLILPGHRAAATCRVTSLLLAPLLILVRWLLTPFLSKERLARISIDAIAYGLTWRCCVLFERYFDKVTRIVMAFVRPDIVHVFRPDEVTSGAIMGAKRSGVVVIYSETGEALPSLPSYSEDVVRAVPLADLVIVMCSHVAEKARRLYGNDINVTVVPPLVPKLRAVPPRQVDEVVSLCYAGRLSPEKNLYGLLQALALLEPERPKWRLLVGGDGPELERCRDFAKSNGLKDRVIFAGPYRLTEDFSQMAADTDLFVVPSHTEGYGLILLEIAASGRPVVATPVGAAINIVLDGDTGFLSRGSAPSEIADALRRAFARHADLPRMGVAARRLYDQSFHPERILKDMMATYEGI